MRKFDTYNGCISLDDFRKMLYAQKILGFCIADVDGGYTIDGKDYVPLFTMHDLEDIKDALDIIASAFGISIKFEEEVK